MFDMDDIILNACEVLALIKFHSETAEKADGESAIWHRRRMRRWLDVKIRCRIDMGNIDASEWVAQNIEDTRARRRAIRIVRDGGIKTAEELSVYISKNESRLLRNGSNGLGAKTMDRIKRSLKEGGLA